MKKILLSLVIVFTSMLTAATLSAATPEQEKAFTDSYKKAFEAKDEKALKAYLYTEGAQPQILELLTAMMLDGMGQTITSIELVAVTPEEAKGLAEAQPLPDGSKAKFPLKIYKKLIIKIETKDANGSSSSSNTSYVAEKDGKLVIPIPVPAK